MPYVRLEWYNLNYLLVSYINCYVLDGLSFPLYIQFSAGCDSQIPFSHYLYISVF